MKRIGITILTFLVLFCSSNNVSFSQNIGNGELMIVNNTQDQSPLYLKINVYPVGAVFSGGRQYTLDARFPIDVANNKIFGFTKILKYDKTLPEQEWTAKINFDATSDILNCESSLGYGKYRIDFYHGQSIDSFSFSDYCMIDYSDANYGTDAFQGEQKIRIDYRSISSLTFNFLNSTTPHSIDEVGKAIKVWEQFGNGLNPSEPSKGIFNDTTIAAYHDFPIDARQFGAVDHISPGEFNLNFTIKYPGAAVRQNQSLKFLRSIFTISEGIEIPFNQSAEISVYGKNGKFESRPGSVVEVPADFVIKVSDSADINVDGAKFTTGSSQMIWRGIRLQNIGRNSSIINSDIEFADTAVSLTENSGNPFVLKSNRFKVFRTSGNSRAIFTRNSYNLLIQGNDFFLPDVDQSGDFREAAIHILCYMNFQPTAKVHSINIADNNFYGGYYQVNVLGFASNYIPVYISGNHFEDAFYNFLARKCTGFVKNNRFVNRYEPAFNGIYSASINTNYSSLNLYGNSFKSIMYNIISGYLSYPNIAPVVNQNNQLIWTGGKNDFVNDYLDNIYIHNGGYLFADLGENIFELSDLAFRNIYGFVDDSCTVFHANRNCWIGNNRRPVIKLYNDAGLITYFAKPSPDCQGEIQPVGYLNFDNGYNLTNSIIVSGNNSPVNVPEDELLFSGALENISSGNPEQAINKYKELIDNYPQSSYLESSLDKLYRTYSSIDTIDDQNVTNQLMGDLRDYLRSKICEYGDREHFVRVAYELMMMCETRMKNYHEAMSGYEFIVLYDKDSVYRINAAIEYASVSLLANGSGGSESSGNGKHKRERPVQTILKKIFNKRSGYEKKSGNHGEEGYIKAADLINKSKVLNDRELTTSIENQMLEQISISGNNVKDNLKSENPMKIGLSQNYPNPFNPSTLISFTIPENGYISLVVYDVSGKEVQRIADRLFKEKGEHSFLFDGRNLPSGIYFYSLKVNNMIQTRQMVLIK